MPVFVLAGEEDLEVYRRVDQLKSELVDPAWSSFNFARLENPSLLDIIDASCTLPFGSGARVVLVDRCELFTKKKRGADAEKLASEKQIKAQLEQFDAALASMPEHTYLIFACLHNFDSTLRLSKVVASHARIEEFPKERYWPGSHNPRLETWCQKEARRHGATIDDAAIAYLLDSTEANLRQLASEIAKAAIYLLPDTHITLETVCAVSAHHSHVFSLMEHWAVGAKKLALQDLEELLSRQSAMPIIAALHTTLSKWVQLKAMAAAEEARLNAGPGRQRREIPPADMARRLAPQLGMKPFPVEMDLKRIRKLGLDELVEKRQQLCHLEQLVKTGQMPDHQALTMLIVS